jgi:hypothetical protein
MFLAGAINYLGEDSMTRDDVKDKIDDAATKAKDAVDDLADKAQSTAKNVGTKVEKAGQKIKESGR